jgi:hypothetical protein
MSATNNNHSENKLQSDCVLWLWNTHPATRGLLYHIPNGGLRSAREGATFKAMGVVAGIPDLCLAIPRNGFAALYLEMKTGTGALSPDQIKEHGRLQDAGNKVVVCRSLEEFKCAVMDYLKASEYLKAA